MTFKLDYAGIIKALGPRMMQRALHTFDQATMVVVGVCWAGALLMMIFSLYTLNLSAKAQRAVVEAAADEPSLPKVESNKLSDTELDGLVDRLHRRFPDIGLSKGRDQTLTVSTDEGGRFRLWLTVLSYIDTVSPQYRWSIQEFCVGLKCAGAPMKAILSAEKITFKAEAPSKGP